MTCKSQVAVNRQTDFG